MQLNSMYIPMTIIKAVIADVALIRKRELSIYLENIPFGLY